MPKEIPSELPQKSYTERRDGLKDMFNAVFRKGVTFKKDIVQNYSNKFNFEDFVKSEKASATDKRADIFLKKLSSKDDAAIEVKALLQATLEAGTDTLVAANNAYQDYAKKLNESKSSYSPAVLLSLRKEALDKSHTEITNNYDKVSKNIKALFDDTHFNENLQKMGLNEQQITALKDDLTESISNYHKKLLGEFEKVHQDELKQLHQEEQRSIESMLFLRKLYSNDKKYQKEIDEILLKKEAEDAQTVLSFNEQGCYVSSDDVEKLEKIRHLGGFFGLGEHAIEKQKDGSYKLKQGVPFYPTNIIYYLLNQNKKQLLDMAKAIRLAGHDSVVIDIDFNNEDRGKETARRAYQACLEAGFSPDKITLNYKGSYFAHKAGKTTVKGAEVEAKSISDYLYEKKPNYFQYLQDRASKVKDKAEKQLDPYKKTSPTELYKAREAMKEGRRQEQEAELQNNLTPPDASTQQDAAARQP